MTSASTGMHQSHHVSTTQLRHLLRGTIHPHPRYTPRQKNPGNLILRRAKSLRLLRQASRKIIDWLMLSEKQPGSSSKQASHRESVQQCFSTWDICSLCPWPVSSTSHHDRTWKKQRSPSSKQPGSVPVPTGPVGTPRSKYRKKKKHMCHLVSISCPVLCRSTSSDSNSYRVLLRAGPGVIHPSNNSPTRRELLYTA